ncbi:hypothetical protein ABZ612_38630 [Streptomyces avermitilis]|uniref:hypothetical protein n=1 Tax=Streptomyces avermitilis TaxID=33903 RepID=UPI0033C3294C
MEPGDGGLGVVLFVLDGVVEDEGEFEDSLCGGDSGLVNRRAQRAGWFGAGGGSGVAGDASGLGSEGGGVLIESGQELLGEGDPVVGPGGIGGNLRGSWSAEVCAEC